MDTISKKLNISILVVDDVKANRDIIKAFLTDSVDYNILLFEGGNQAYEYIYRLKTHDPILLITDILMPDIDGLNLLKKLRTLKHVYTIIITGHGHENDLKEAFDSGAIDFIRKPIEKIELISRTRNIIRIISTEYELRRNATTDFLTGAHSRKFFFDHAEREIKIAKRYNQPLSFITIDVDNFKNINDNLGHQAGDEVLKLFCIICKKNIRETDHFARLGGDEFVLALINSDVNRAKLVAERIRCDVLKQNVKYKGHVINFTVSQGVAGYLGENDNIKDILNRADRALYMAKNSGRNVVQSY